jgi:hypothetical protein
MESAFANARLRLPQPTANLVDILPECRYLDRRVGKPNFVTADMVAKGSVLIDCWEKRDSKRMAVRLMLAISCSMPARKRAAAINSGARWNRAGSLPGVLYLNLVKACLMAAETKKSS